MLDLVDRVKAITGRIDLVHANNSKGAFNSGQDRHDNLDGGTIDPELVVAVIRAADAPVIVETPGGATVRAPTSPSCVSSSARGPSADDHATADRRRQTATDHGRRPRRGGQPAAGSRHDRGRRRPAAGRRKRPASRDGSRRPRSPRRRPTPSEAAEPTARQRRATDARRRGEGGTTRATGTTTADQAGRHRPERPAKEGRPGTDEAGRTRRRPAGGEARAGPAPRPTVVRLRARARAGAGPAPPGGPRRSAGSWCTSGPWPSSAALALAVAMTWPTLRYPLYTLPQDYWDPSLQAWQMAWSGHILLTDPAQLCQSNTFFPEPWSFAFSDILLGYAPAGMIGTGPEAAVLRYNIMFVLAHALATFGAYALARQLGAGRIGAAVAGVGYTYAPWLLAQAGHLHIVSNGGIPLALAMLARGHGWSLRHGYRPERRHAGLGVRRLGGGRLAAQPGLRHRAAVRVRPGRRSCWSSAATWFVRRRSTAGAAARSAAGCSSPTWSAALLFAAVGALLAVPYFKVAELHPNAARTIGDIAVYSPPASGFFTAPAESRIWGGLHEGARAVLPWHPEMTLLPGFVLYALAAGGLFFSVWRLRHRLLLLAGVLVTMVLAMGTRFFGGTFTYAPLFEYLPGWNGLRTPGRMMLWTTLLLGLLAAGAVSAFAAAGPRAGRRAGAVLAGPVAAGGHPAAAAAGGRRGAEQHAAPGGAGAAGGDAHRGRSDAGAAEQPEPGPAGDALVDQPVPAHGQRRQRLHPDTQLDEVRRVDPRLPRPGQRRLPAHPRRPQRGGAARPDRRHAVGGDRRRAGRRAGHHPRGGRRRGGVPPL